jgi:NADPH-dependent ferric siderophore reductase
MSLRTETTIPLPDVEAVLAPLCEHMLEHDARVTREAGETVIALGEGLARMRAGASGLSVVIDAPDLASLQELKRAIASHVVEFAPAGTVAAISWTGDGAAPSLPPDFRILTVTAIRDLTPHMRRIRFRGEDLARYASLEALHVRLFLPPDGVGEPAWPMLGADGMLVQPDPALRPAVRKYTLREINPAAGTLAIDFVLHDDAGPGSAFAARACVGDNIGMAGPGGRGLRAAGRYVFLCDETGLPAVARMLENLSADAQGCVFIEVASAADELQLAAPAGIAISWLLRGAESGTDGSALRQAFDALEWPGEGPEIYLWSATENEDFRYIRAAARQRLRPGHDHHLVVSYWRRGLSEDQHAAAKKAARAG